MRMCVVKNKDHTVSCLPVSQCKNHYYKNYDVICFVKKEWNPYFVGLVKKYFSKS